MSSSDISDSENVQAVAGFQFEPMKKNRNIDNLGWKNDDDVSDEEELVHDMRKAMDVNSWCDCGECAKMATEKECLCCQELNSAQLHELGGKCFSFLTSPQINVVTSTLFIFYY